MSRGLTMKEVMKIIKSNRHKLTYQQYRTLIGQCLAGDFIGAKKGLYRILWREKSKK